MTARFRKKVRKWRGRTSHGWGAKKKHRGGGSRGGRGLSGYHKHKFSFVVSKDPGHFGKKGFHPLKPKEKIINVGELNRFFDSKAEIDLSSLGYTKLLSRGQVRHPYKIKVAKFTERAKAKIEKAGGEIIK